MSPDVMYWALAITLFVLLVAAILNQALAIRAKWRHRNHLPQGEVFTLYRPTPD